MALSDYTELQAAIASWLNRSDLTSHITDFITLNEAECNRLLRTSDQITRAQASFNEEYELLPTDCLQVRQLSIDSTNPNRRLQYRTPDYFAARNDNLDTGIPEDYTIVGDTFRLRPVPDTTYTGEMVYYAEIPALSGSNATNWLLTRAPDVYLYGSLKHSANFLLDDARLPMWESLYQRAMAGLNEADQRKRFPTPVQAKRIG